jgi:hypothetical protein
MKERTMFASNRPPARRRGADEQRSAGSPRHASPPFPRKPLFEALEQRLLLSTTIAGAIDTPGETDRYAFTIAAERRLYIDPQTNVDFTWTLAGPQGAVVANRDFRSSDANDFGGNPFVTLVPGDYVLSVDAAGDRTGAYRLQLLDRTDAAALTTGTVTTATLDPTASTQLYAFSATAGERFFFDARGVTNGTAQWRLFAPDGSQVFNVGATSDVDVIRVDQTGEYLLAVEGRIYNGTAGTTGVTFTVQPVADDTAALTLGARVDGAIAHAGQVDRYTFTLTERRTLIVDPLSPSAFNWTLGGPAGTVASRDFRSSDGIDFGGTPALDLVAGDYSLTIDPAGDTTGAYAIRVLDVAAATAIATPVAGTPTSVGGTLDPATSTAMYRFDAAAGDRFFFDYVSATQTDARWRLLGPYGDVVFERQFNADQPEVTLALAGTYTVLVEGRVYNGGTNAFAFNVEYRGNTPPVPLAGDPITLGQVVSGAISGSGEVDRYVFTLADRTRVYFDNRTNTSTTWQLVGPRGTVFGPRDMRFTDGPDGYLHGELVPGTYQLTLSGTVAPYSFRLLDLASATPIAVGTPVLGQTLDPANASALYRFDGTAGQLLYFDVRQSTNTDGRIRLIGPLGNQIWETGLGSDVDVFALPRAGTYTLLFEGRYYYPTGTTTFGFNLQPIADATQPLVLGARVDGTIATAGETDFYAFTLGAATRVAFDSLADVDMRWTLRGPNGTIVSDRSLRSSDAFEGFAVLTLVGGEYTLSVSGPADATGSYAFRLLDLGIASVIVPGVSAAGTLSPGNETDVFRLEGIAGQRYFFDAVSATTTDTVWRLFDP